MGEVDEEEEEERSWGEREDSKQWVGPRSGMGVGGVAAATTQRYLPRTAAR